MFLFGNQRQVTPKWIVISRRNSNLSVILCLPSLFRTGSGLFLHSIASNSEVNNPINDIQPFITVLVTCKLYEDPIKWRPATPDNILTIRPIYKCVSGFSLEKTRYGRSEIIFYVYFMHFRIFLSFVSVYLTICCSSFSIKCEGLEQKPS